MTPPLFAHPTNPVGRPRRNTSLPRAGRQAGLMFLFTRRAYMLAMPASLITGTIGKHSGKNIPPQNIPHSRNGAAPPTGTLLSVSMPSGSQIV